MRFTKLRFLRCATSGSRPERTVRYWIAGRGSLSSGTGETPLPKKRRGTSWLVVSFPRHLRACTATRWEVFYGVSPRFFVGITFTDHLRVESVRLVDLTHAHLGMGKVL